jgi:hypothetical protein
MFAESHASGIDLTPYVYVRDVETLYAETACAKVTRPTRNRTAISCMVLPRSI